jgi:hypothetical protein
MRFRLNTRRIIIATSVVAGSTGIALWAAPKLQQRKVVL